MMEEKAQPNSNVRPSTRKIAELREQVDERDETIRLLNEALSRALDELDRSDQAAA